MNDKHETETPTIAQNFVQQMLRDDAELNNGKPQPSIATESNSTIGPITATEPAIKSENSENLTNRTIKEEPIELDSTVPVPEQADGNQNDKSEVISVVSLSDYSHQLSGNSLVFLPSPQQPDVNANHPVVSPTLQYRPIKVKSLAQSLADASALSNSLMPAANESISITSNVAATTDTKPQPNIPENRGIKNPAPKGKYRVVRVKLEPPTSDVDSNISIFPTARIKTEK